MSDWFRANADVMGDRDLLRQVAETMDRGLADGKNIRIILDGKLVRGGGSRFLATWSGRFYEFPITTAQCRAAGAAAGAAVGSLCVQSESAEVMEKPVIQIEDLKVDDEENLPGNHAVTGTASYSIVGEIPEGQIVVRAMYRAEASSAMAYRVLSDFPKVGKVSFLLDPVNEKATDVQFGPTLVMVDILVLRNGAPAGLVASNTIGRIVDVQPDPEGFVRSGIQFMNRASDILESVRDEKTAAMAIQEYRKEALKNRSVVDAMERLGTLPPDQLEALSKKYESQMNAATARLQTQVKRIEAAPYAGEAFLTRIEASLAE
ncbi:MAG: hypothetical protein H6819_04225 [Phycisphaerales bacterium]|nr:hypothetical protein [Phycisphaerales bacterium]MCB9856406.1 hypothetical protein [Phycisphaerales bacterium]MCB9864537.1 hypothetical protein [Phycisphaerales bacterium]